ncbi:C45 family peptidase [bacterium]|nr:C45 family peptidase [bacterium]
MSELPFPLITIEGSPQNRGIQYGNQCKELIRNTVDFYRSAFKTGSGLDWDQSLEKAMEFVSYIEEYDAEIMEELRGIAEGARCSLGDILAINIRSELLFLLSTQQKLDLPSCTAMAAMPEATADRLTFLAQNWDWYDQTRAQCIILKIKQPGRPTIIQLVEAGLIAKTGMNSAGIGMCTNSLVCDNWRVGVPFHVILRGILNADSMAAAVGAVTKAYRASAGNYMIGHTDGVALNIEAAPETMNFIYPESGTIVHTNHFLVNNPDIKDLIPAMWPYSITRNLRASTLVAAARDNIDLEAIKRVLRDHFDKPLSICTHVDRDLLPDSKAQTNASIVLNLSRQELYIAKGPPCEHSFVNIEYTWD